jgi:hypothetical protein
MATNLGEIEANMGTSSVNEYILTLARIARQTESRI